VLPEKVVFWHAKISVKKAARRRPRIRVLRHNSLLNGANSSQQVVDESLQVAEVLALIDIQTSVIEGSGIGCVYAWIKIDCWRGILRSNAAPLVDVPLIAEIDAPLEGMRPMLVGHVVHKLIGRQVTRIANVVLQRNVHAGKSVYGANRISEKVERRIIAIVRVW